jgi:ADP-L-glycero-D-manno-heptose 6-epimerase
MIVITGGAGFIGANLVESLARKGHKEIVVCDTLDSSNKWENLNVTPFYYFVHPDNLIDFLTANVNKISCLVHLGAISATTEKNAELLLENNYRFSVSLWEWCINYGKRIIYASSAATYGDGTLGFDDDHSNIWSLKPLNPYGWSKQIFDLRVIQDQMIDKVPPQWVGLKFFNVFGPYEHHKEDMMSVICKLYPKVMKEEPVQLFKSHKPVIEDGDQKRDFIWVKDCVKVILWFINNEMHSGIFNLGTGKARSFLDLANCLYNACNKQPNIHFIPMPEQIRDKYQYFTEAKMTKLKTIGYEEEFTDLQEAINQYVEYLSNYYASRT